MFDTTKILIICITGVIALAIIVPVMQTATGGDYPDCIIADGTCAGSSVEPCVDGVYDLGTATHRWDDIYAVDLIVSGTATIGGNTIVREGYNHLPEVWVAASNSSNEAKRAAQFVCDGTADEVEIQAAIAMATNNYTRGGKVNLAAGEYKIASTIRVTSGLAIEGRGLGNSDALNTRLTLVPGANCNMFEFDSSLSPGNIWFRMSNLDAIGNKAGQSGTSSFFVAPGTGSSTLWDFHMDNMMIQQFKTGGIWAMGTSWGWDLANMVIEYNNMWGVRLDNGGWPKIVNCKVNSNGINLWVTNGADGGMVSNSEFCFAEQDGVVLDTVGGWKFTNSRFGANCKSGGTAEVSVISTSSEYKSANSFIGCNFDHSAASTNTTGLYLSTYATNPIVQGCTFDASYTSSIAWDGWSTSSSYLGINGNQAAIGRGEIRTHAFKIGNASSVPTIKVAWQNPYSQPVLIRDVTYRVIDSSDNTGCHIDIGVVQNSTTSGANCFDDAPTSPTNFIGYSWKTTDGGTQNGPIYMDAKNGDYDYITVTITDSAPTTFYNGEVYITIMGIQ